MGASLVTTGSVGCEALARCARDLAIVQGITVREAYRELGRRAGKASAAKRREKQLSTRS